MGSRRCGLLRLCTGSLAAMLTSGYRTAEVSVKRLVGMKAGASQSDGKERRLTDAHSLWLHMTSGPASCEEPRG